MRPARAILEALTADIIAITTLTPEKVKMIALSCRKKKSRKTIVTIKAAIPSNINARPASLLTTAHISGLERVECVLIPNA